MRERTILMGGFSKAYAMTGWRVGYLAAPAAILEGIVKVHQYGIMSAPTTAQDAALEAIVGGEADVERMLAEYDRRRRLVVDGLNALGLQTFEPRGAFYAFPRIAATGLSAEAFAERLLRRSASRSCPGSAFGPSGEGHVRMCYATSYEELEEALGRIGRFVAAPLACRSDVVAGAGALPRSPRSRAAGGTGSARKLPRRSYASGVRNQRPRS